MAAPRGDDAVAVTTRTRPHRPRRDRGLFAAAVLAPSTAAAAPADYDFTVVADSGADDLDPFAFGCASINAGGDIAFHAGRPGVDGASGVDGIYRADAGTPGIVRSPTATGSTSSATTPR